MKDTNSCIRTGRALALLLAALMITATVSGCSDDASASVATPLPTPTESGEIIPQPGGSLTLPMPEGGKIGNPLTVTTREMSSVCGLVFESLLVIDENGAPGPCLAETWEDSGDGLFCHLDHNSPAIASS